MNRFLAFFFLSFLLHIAMGAVLLSRTGILGGRGTETVELSDLTENSEEIRKAKNTESFTKDSLKNKELLDMKLTKEGKKQSSSKVKKPAKKVNKKVVKKTKPPVKKPSAEQLKKHPVEQAADTAKPVKEPVQKESQKTSDKTTSAEEGEWEDEKEMIEEVKDEKPASEKQELIKEDDSEIEEIGEKEEESKEALGEEGSSDEDAGEGQEPENTPPPTPRPTPSPAPSEPKKPSDSNKNTVPGLDIGTARIHSQLHQMEDNPIPVYPKEALKKSWEGRAEVVYYVNPAGFVEKIQLRRSSGHSILDNSALRALSRYRYYPGQEGWVRHPVEFLLELDKEIIQTAPLGLRKPTSE